MWQLDWLILTRVFLAFRFLLLNNNYYITSFSRKVPGKYLIKIAIFIILQVSCCVSVAGERFSSPYNLRFINTRIVAKKLIYPLLKLLLMSCIVILFPTFVKRNWMMGKFL